MLQRRKPKDCLPSHTSVMGIIMKCLPMCGPDGMERFEFKCRFEKAKKDLGKDDCSRNRNNSNRQCEKQGMKCERQNN